MDNNRKSRKISLGFLDKQNSATRVDELLDKLLKKKNALPPQNLFYSPTPVQKQIKLPTLFFKGKTSGNTEANIQKNVTQQNENSSQNSRTLQVGNFTNFCPNVVSTPAPVVIANQQGFNNSVNSSSANISSNDQLELAECGVDRLSNSSRTEIENNELLRNVIVQNMRLGKSNSLNNINQKQRQPMINHNHIDLNPNNENSEKENEDVQHSRNIQSKNITHNQTIENSNKDSDVNKNLNSDKRNSKSITSKTIILDEELNGNNEEEVVAVVNHNNDVDNNVDELRNENINMIFRDNTLKTNDRKRSSGVTKNKQKDIVQKIPNTITTTTIANSSNKNLNVKPQNKNSSAANKITNHVEENLMPSSINNDANEKDNNTLFNIQSNLTTNTNDISRTTIRSTLDKNRASNMIALRTYSNELNEILSQVNGDNEDLVEEVLPDSQPKWLLSAIENKRIMSTMNNFKEPKSKLSNRRRKTKQNVDPVKECYLQTTNNILQNKTKLCINSICSNISDNNTIATDRCGKRVLHTKGRSQEPEDDKQQSNNNDKECNFDVQLISNQEKSSANRKNTTTIRSSLSLPPPSSPPQSSPSPSLLESDDIQNATTDVQVRMKKLTRNSAKNSNRTMNRSNKNKKNSELNENDIEPKAKRKYNNRQKSINKKHIPKTVKKNTKNDKQQRQQESNIQNDCPEMTTDETTGLRRSKREHKGLTAYWLNDKPPITETDIWQKLYKPLNENKSTKNKNVNSLTKKTNASTSTRNERSSRNQNKKSSKSQKNHLDVVVEENINENEIQIDNDRTLVNEEIIESTDIIEATEIIKDNNCNNSKTIINNGLNVINLYKNINFNPVVRIKRKRKIINSDSGAECDYHEPIKQNNQQNKQQKQQQQEQQQNQDNHDHQTEIINDVDHNNSENNNNFNNELWINNFIKCDWKGDGQVFQKIITVRKASKVSAKHLCFVEHGNVEYAYYRSETGYIRIRPNKEKKYCRANKFALKMFILAGNVDFYFNDTILSAKHGDYIDIEKGAYYKIKNDSTEIALILFVICK